MLRFAMSIATLALVLGLLLPSTVNAKDASSNLQSEPPLILERAISINGTPDSIVVDCWNGRNDILFYDSKGSKVRFLNGDTLELSPDELYLPHRGFDSWMAYDRTLGHTYLLQVQRENDWDNVYVTVINRRTLVRSFSVNEQFNANIRVDFPYVVTGFASKPAFLELNTPGRLVIDNVMGGRLDVVDLDATGLKALNIERYAYRQPLTASVIRTFRGSSIALEPKYETELDTLGNKDLLYLMDGNVSDTRIRRFRVWHGATSPLVSELSPVDLGGTFPLSNGVQGLFVNGPADQLLVGTSLQSFDEGTAASVRTSGNAVELLHFDHADSGFVYADWYDPKRVFVTTFDDFFNDPEAALRLRLLYGNEQYALILDSGLTAFPYVRDMAFDPYHNRLYITSEDKIYVVKVNVGADSPKTPEPRPAAGAVTLVSPFYFGTLNVADDRAEITFVGDSVDRDTEVLYTELLYPPDTGALHPVRVFRLSATQTAETSSASAFAKPYYMTLNYTQAELGPVVEATCGLYRWNGSRWTPITSAAIDRQKNEITVSDDATGIFAILGEPVDREYLPALSR